MTPRYLVFFMTHTTFAPSPCVQFTLLPQDPPSQTNPGSVPLRRTTTGIISNQRPILGTPASTSGSTTPNSNTDADAPGPLSLLATAKREAAKRSLYSRFFRGPVLGPSDDPRADTTSPFVPSSSESSSVSTPAPEHVGDRHDVIGEPKKSKNRKSEDKVETKEERRERKRLKSERKAARAAKKVEKALAREKAKGKRDVDLKARKQRDREIWSEENEAFPYPKKGREQPRKSVAGSERDNLEPAKCIRKNLGEELALPDNGQQDTSYRPLSKVDATDAFNVVITTKKKRKRRDTPL